jgi:hypothetical protein
MDTVPQQYFLTDSLHESTNEEVDRNGSPVPEDGKDELSQQGDGSDIPEIRIEAFNYVVDLYQSGMLQELVEWFEANQERKIIMSDLPTRPVFKGPFKNTGIKISNPIRRAALRRAKKEQTRVGGSLSALVEYLLWQYIDCPDDMIS